MWKTIIFSLFFLLINEFSVGQVKVAGAMKRIMQQGNLEATVLLDTLLPNDHLYGLGAAADLKGEIMIIEGRPYCTFVDKDKIVTHGQKNITASMLVYATVQQWSGLIQGNETKNLKDLEVAIETLAKQNSVDITRPFPFIIKIKQGTVAYHVIDWRDNVPHTADTHKQYSKTGSFHNEELLLLGFFSKNHQGVFTHHASSIHAHVINKDHTIVGHVDDAEFLTFDLLLPVIY